MAIQVLNTKDLTTQGVKCLVYGPAGSGKTRLCATAPRPIVLSAESGLLSIRDSALPYVKIKKVSDLVEVRNWILNSAESKNFDTICLDSLSEIAEVFLTNLECKHGQKAFFELKKTIIEVVRDFRDLDGKNVYFSAKEELSKVDYNGSSAFKFLPAMPGQKVGPELPYFFDEVFQLSVFNGDDGKTFGALRTQPTPQHEAKDRSGKLDPWEKPDLTQIFNKIMGVV